MFMPGQDSEESKGPTATKARSQSLLISQDSKV